MRRPLIKFWRTTNNTDEPNKEWANWQILIKRKTRAMEARLTIPVCSTRSMSSSHAALSYSSIIEAMRILPGYSSFSCLNSLNIVSRGRSLISSIFSHPIICPLAEPFAPALRRAYRGVTLITLAASSDT